MRVSHSQRSNRQCQLGHERGGWQGIQPRRGSATTLQLQLLPAASARSGWRVLGRQHVAFAQGAWACAHTTAKKRTHRAGASHAQSLFQCVCVCLCVCMCVCVTFWKASRREATAVGRAPLLSSSSISCRILSWKRQTLRLTRVASKTGRDAGCTPSLRHHMTQRRKFSSRYAAMKSSLLQAAG